MHLTRLHLILASLVVAALASLCLTLTAQHAVASSTFSIPASYGQCKGAMGNALIFEDADGTVRIVTLSGRVEMTVHRRG